jgi:2,5-diketo-D-gluconate reductase A
MNRRKFLKTGSLFTVASMFISFGGQKIFGHSSSKSIPITILNNGVIMPFLGFGTYSLRGDICVESVHQAILSGYRLIDTATIYGNEEFVGKGIKKSGINRAELFITSKVWVDDSGYQNTLKAFDTSIKKLGVDYLDLYLIHRPRGDVRGSWTAMEELYSQGKIKAIGVSNFEPLQLEELLEYATIKPVVNQIETHAFYQQLTSYKNLIEQDIQLEAWSPLAQGRNGLFTNKTLAEIGDKYGKSNAQISLRWHFQRGIVAIPRTEQKSHMLENLDIFDFELSELDMKTIAQLDLNSTQFPEWK